MPYRIERPCKAYMCPNTTSNKSGYCDEHQGLAREHRGSAYSRGYNGRWDRFRTRYLREHPLCADCLEDPLPGLPPQPATEIHHVKKLRDFPDLKYKNSNLRGLCKRHHSMRTARGE
jgi:5-methylcytosine-specific restriction protein A